MAKSSCPHKVSKSRLLTPPAYEVIKKLDTLDPSSFFAGVLDRAKADMITKFSPSDEVRRGEVEPNLRGSIDYHRRHIIPIPHEDPCRATSLGNALGPDPSFPAIRRSWLNSLGTLWDLILPSRPAGGRG